MVMGSQATDQQLTGTSMEAIVQLLRSKGLRVTPQRFAVYANLLARSDHPTADQILSDLNQEVPISSQATVYSSLQALREAGLVREVLLEEGVSRYDANVQPHHHFQCRCCGVISDIPWETFQNLSLNQLYPRLYAETYEVTVRGLCEQCQVTNAKGL
ncbi:MAG: transcriptional repressor [Cyanobacteria bacterium]|nr:transcriptional repressor [Cyanobacteriota bacterium]MDW8200343.1 Fur family transcriptional regulator [Cyanobacteriota bacterium SKYGB_h_bin112]